MPFGCSDGLLVTGIRMADDAHARVGGQDALQPTAASGVPSATMT